MFLLASQTNNGICLWCVFVLMLGSFLIGYFAKNLKAPTKKEKESISKEKPKRLKPLGIIKTMERSGNEVKETES